MRHWAELLRRHGLKATAQRVALAQAMLARPRHATPQQLHAELAARMPGLSVNTVYQMLRQFEQAGLVRMLTFGGRMWFDSNIRPHAHIVCRICGRIEDAPMISLPAPQAPGWQLEDVEVIWQGRCARCR